MEPAMISPVSTLSASSNRHSYSCIRCASRKVKCDRQKPCGGCFKQNVDCVFRVPPARKKRKRAKRDALDDRLKRYESLLREQGIDPDLPDDVEDENEEQSVSRRAILVAAENLPQVPTPASTASTSQRCITKTQLLRGQDRSTFLDNSLWTRVVEELHTPEDVLDDDLSYDGMEDDTDDFAYILGTDSRLRSTVVHPSPDHVLRLWETFTENIDPLTKIVHVPTLRPAIVKAAHNSVNLPNAFEALLCSIYSMAIISLTEHQCQQMFGAPRKTLLSRYVSHTKSALSRANFMASGNLIVLQALVLHILSVREMYEPRVVWNLTGVAIRIAEGMGLHRDGISLGLSPFETEIRRCVWWQLKMHEFRTAELSGLPKFRKLVGDTDTTRSPSNINDTDFHPNMLPPGATSNGPSDMMFCAMKANLGGHVSTQLTKMCENDGDGRSWDDRALNSGPRLQEFMNEAEEALETGYLRFCDPSQPLHLMTMLAARSALNGGRFLAHHPRRWVDRKTVPEPDQRYVWDLSIKLLEQYDMMQSNPLLQRFAWNVGYYLQWHAFIHILDSLRARPLMSDAPKAWKLVECTYRNNPDLLSNVRRPIYVAVGLLCLKSFDVREHALRNDGVSVFQAPTFIIKLRQQREAAKARRQMRIDERVSKDHSTNSNIPSAGHEHATIHSGILPNISSSFDVTFQPAPIAPGGTGYERNSAAINEFWSKEGFQRDILSIPSELETSNLDLTFTENDLFGDSDAQNINWEQWDAWLNNSIISQANLASNLMDS